MLWTLFLIRLGPWYIFLNTWHKSQRLCIFKFESQKVKKQNHLKILWRYASPNIINKSFIVSVRFVTFMVPIQFNYIELQAGTVFECNIFPILVDKSSKYQTLSHTRRRYVNIVGLTEHILYVGSFYQGLFLRCLYRVSHWICAAWLNKENKICLFMPPLSESNKLRGSKCFAEYEMGGTLYVNLNNGDRYINIIIYIPI